MSDHHKPLYPYDYRTRFIPSIGTRMIDKIIEELDTYLTHDQDPYILGLKDKLQAAMDQIGYHEVCLDRCANHFCNRGWQSWDTQCWACDCKVKLKWIRKDEYEEIRCQAIQSQGS